MNSRILRFSTVAALMLLLFLLAVMPLFHQTARAQSGQLLNYTSKKGQVQVACSADGKVVYVVGDEGIVRSTDYGKKGTWEKVLSED